MTSIYADYQALSQGAAKLFAEQSEVAIRARGRFSVALAGGGTPRLTYELLARSPFREVIKWSQLHVFWGDERCVPRNDLRSNARMVREALLEKVPVIPSQIHPIVCHARPQAAVHQYEDLLRAFFAEGIPRLDLVFLGLGENGHTASLFPHSQVLKEEQRWVGKVYEAEPQLHRITLTAPLINQAVVVAFLVSGPAKARVLSEVMEGPRDPMRLPAQLIQPERYGGKLYWLLDEPAASRLRHLPAGTI